jgi:hypothetical protein
VDSQKKTDWTTKDLETPFPNSLCYSTRTVTDITMKINILTQKIMQFHVLFISQSYNFSLAEFQGLIWWGCLYYYSYISAITDIEINMGILPSMNTKYISHNIRSTKGSVSDEKYHCKGISVTCKGKKR